VDNAITIKKFSHTKSECHLSVIYSYVRWWLSDPLILKVEFFNTDFSS